MLMCGGAFDSQSRNHIKVTHSGHARCTADDVHECTHRKLCANITVKHTNMHALKLRHTIAREPKKKQSLCNGRTENNARSKVHTQTQTHTIIIAQRCNKCSRTATTTMTTTTTSTMTTPTTTTTTTTTVTATKRSSTAKIVN